MSDHEKYMQRCIDLARKGLGNTYPNPMVGSVIVHNDEIIGEGYHQKSGESHAEINAINSVKDKSLLTESTLYVNLEPCCHHGKTPPCSDHLIEKNIKNVVIGCKDLSSKVNGKGIEILKNSNCKVIENILEEPCKELNKRFFTYNQKKRPYVILKWAQTKDGFFAPKDNQQLWITNEKTKQMVHKWRAEEQAIMVGFNTAKIDNPKLDVRVVEGENPVRITVDKNLDLPAELHLFNDKGQTIVFNSIKNEIANNINYVTIDFQANFPNQILNNLYTLEIQSLIIEGGAKTLNSFIEHELWDEARIFIGQKEITEGIKAPKLDLDPTSKENISGDELLIYNCKF
ncbi:MAG: riboflavin biosynthesis protein RibD [Bacteroidetes bacterium]|nr:bifunctional diaminohydroxyphosphoribosylaminopyrimidine deaminase/5-amino-6-(5-phosphoribosylamino)uracil reductase RibD [Sphingobacteriaceae bacterium AH-315-L07]PCH68097.1 MAG: riboflavin biosynthesis protein RibD [Bacteroidota bacterium]